MFKKVTRQSATYINRLPSFPDYVEEGQDLPIKFQFFLTLPERQYYLLHGPVQCRDFLGDVVCSQHFQNRSSIWGFEVDFEKWSTEVLQKHEEWWHKGLKITFPSVAHKKNFCTNFESILNRFGFSKIDFRGNDYLNGGVTELHLNVPLHINPVGLSWLTFLVKIASHDIQNHEELVKALQESSPTEFVKQFTSIYSGKDSGYFSRVELETFTWCRLICELAMTSMSFAYLNDHANNISFLHNNSGFFSQFRKEHTGMFANLVGTLINDLEEPVPFKYTPLTDKQRSDLLSGVDIAFSFKGKAGIIKDNKASHFTYSTKAKPTPKAESVNQWLNVQVAADAGSIPVSINPNPWQGVFTLPPVDDTPEEDSIAAASFAWTTSPTPHEL